MTSPAGGLKDIPESARRIALLNQADSPQLQTNANNIAKNILTSLSPTLILKLKPGQNSAKLKQPALRTKSLRYMNQSQGLYLQPEVQLEWRSPNKL
jgi:hypothetical protein